MLQILFTLTENKAKTFQHIGSLKRVSSPAMCAIHTCNHGDILRDTTVNLCAYFYHTIVREKLLLTTLISKKAITIFVTLSIYITQIKHTSCPQTLKLPGDIGQSQAWDFQISGKGSHGFDHSKDTLMRSFSLSILHFEQLSFFQLLKHVKWSKLGSLSKLHLPFHKVRMIISL